MDFVNVFVTFIQDLFESLFASSSPEYKKKQQLKQLSINLKALNPPIFRQDGVLLPAFPAAIFQIFQFLQPIHEILTASLENTDRRVSERYRDYLIELTLTDDQRKLRKSFTFSDRTAALAAHPNNPERFIEDQGKHFSQFLKIVDSSTMHQVGLLLDKIDFLFDLISFDYNNFFAYFDPAFRPHAGKDTTVTSPCFQSIEVVEIIPVLLDLYYLLSKLDISPAVIDVVSILEAKKTGIPLNDEIKNRIQKIFQAVQFVLQKKISRETLLTIIRVIKEDPEFLPDHPVFKSDYIQQYKVRLTEFFHNDSRKLLKDQQENIIQVLINASFGNRKLETLQGYNEETNTLLQEFTPFSLEWIKPVEIIKTFTLIFFEPHFKQILKSVIVEGFFHNRTLQSASSSAYYFCESIPDKLREFELLFEDKQPFSLKVMTGYLSELEKGMDFEKPLRKMVENINTHAKTFIQQSVTQYAEVFNFTGIILDDNKKSIPEYITNMRNLSISTKNSESFAWLEKENDVFRNFLEIMKKYAIIGTLSASASQTDQTES